jgi:hypothetical protein
MHTSALQRPKVADAFHNTNQPMIPLRVGAYGAWTATVEIAAVLANHHGSCGLY